MGQVNVNYDDLVLKGIDRVAGARSLSRPDLLRAIASEAVEAHDAGRLAFQIEDGPRIDGSINALAAQLRDAVIELERAQRANQRHEKKLLDAFVGSEENVRTAQEKLTARINDINRKSYEPFVNRMKDVHALVEALKVELADAQEARLAEIVERLEAVRIEASAPRKQFNLVLGDNRMLSLKFLSVCSLFVGWLAILLFLLTASHAAWIGVPVAKRMLPDTERICRVIDDRFGVQDCQIPEDYRKAVVRAARTGK